VDALDPSLAALLAGEFLIASIDLKIWIRGRYELTF
jgi:hypothetical protein